MEILDALGNIGFDWRIAVANFINFVIIYFLLNKFIFKPLTKTLDERQEKIQSGLQQAADAAELHEKASTEREHLLREARNEAGSIVASAREVEAKVIAESTDKASLEASKIITVAKQKAAEEHEKMITDFKTEAADLVVAATEKLLQDELSAENKNQIATNYLNKVRTNS